MHRSARAGLISLVALIACAAAQTAAAASISKAIRFQNPSRNISCGIEIHAPGSPATEVLCAGPGVPAPRERGIGDPGFVQLGLLGSPRVLRLSQDSFVGSAPVTLGRGRLWNQLGVTCHVALTTVPCFNGDNHGFVIGNSRYRSF